MPTRISTNAESTPRYDFWRATPSPEREFVRVDVERPSDVNALILSYVLATVKEAFAVAPGLTRVRIVALRSTRIDAYGKSGVEAILAARFSRSSFVGVNWDTVDACKILADTKDELTARFVGVNDELAVIDLASEPGIAAVVSAVDIEKLTG